MYLFRYKNKNSPKTQLSFILALFPIGYGYSDVSLHITLKSYKKTLKGNPVPVKNEQTGHRHYSYLAC